MNENDENSFSSPLVERERQTDYFWDIVNIKDISDPWLVYRDESGKLALVFGPESKTLSDYDVLYELFGFLATKLIKLFPEGHKNFPLLEQAFEQILFNYQDKEHEKYLPRIQLEQEIFMLETVELGSKGTMKFPILKNLLQQAGKDSNLL
jgi:hypothetical protein